MNVRAAGPGWLFCPADRPERFAKAAAAADVVILDLEDGVAEADKPAARKALRETPLDPERTVVRINPAGSEEQARDLDALADTAYSTVMLSKTESAAQVTALAPREVVALIETPRGAVFAAEIAAAEGTAAMMWGAEDLVATLGGSSSRLADGTYRDVARHVRSTTLLAASAFGRIALDAVHLDIRDIEGLRAEADDAVAVGFDAQLLRRTAAKAGNGAAGDRAGDAGPGRDGHDPGAVVLGGAGLHSGSTAPGSSPPPRCSRTASRRPRAAPRRGC